MKPVFKRHRVQAKGKRYEYLEMSLRVPYSSENQKFKKQIEILEKIGIQEASEFVMQCVLNHDILTAISEIKPAIIDALREEIRQLKVTGELPESDGIDDSSDLALFLKLV